MGTRPKVDLTTVHNARGRAQRLSDARFYNCVIRSSNENSVEVAVLGEADLVQGDAMRFEIYGHQGVVCLTAVLHAEGDSTFRFALVGPPTLRNATETVRIQVSNMQAHCTWDGGVENAEILDIAPKGIGMRVTERLEPGTEIEMRIMLSSGEIEAKGVCRYCRAIEGAPGFRVGVQLISLGRLDEAKWMTQFESLDAAA